MRTPMTKEVFMKLLERQRESGLTIRAFCLNEAYSPTNFYYWKGKFSSRGIHTVTDSMSDVREDFIPLRFPVSPSRSADILKSGEMNGIMIELPTGIKIHFSGCVGTKAAISLITRMYSGHVLPQ